jgi:polar amino acid transport system ATP-binding protein
MTSVLRVRDLRVRRGSREIVANAHFDVPRGGIVALMGPSGSGKTTILRAIAGLDRIDGGRIDIGSITLTATPASAAALRALHQTVGFVFQFHHLFEHLSVLDNVCLAPVHVHRVRRADAERRAVSLLELLEVEHRAAAMPRELSGGEAQRVAIARALAVDPPLLLMDEPTASLDPARRNELGETLQALAAQGRTLVMTSHDDDFVRDYATRVVILSQGCVVEEGHPRNVLANPMHPATRELLQVERTRSAGDPRFRRKQE